ncbi:MAG: SurA N-terminal domain-containing protein, partial [Desulfobacterales bacterium]
MAQTRRPCRQGISLAGLMLLLGVSAGLFGWEGCDAPASPPAQGVLLRVGELTITPGQFQDRRLQSQFIPLQGPGDDAAPQLPAEGVLRELVEELLIEHYARDQGLKVSDGELDQALAEIRGALPPAEFDTLIIESAQSPQGYRRQLRLRLLRIKAIRQAAAAQSYP